MRSVLQEQHLAKWVLAKDQGRAAACVSAHEASNHWVRGGRYTSFSEYRFALKARLNLLPTRTVRKRSGKAIVDTSCPKCHEEQETHAHVLNHCPPNVGLVRHQHNKILYCLARAIPASKGTQLMEQSVPGDGRSLRPDLVILNKEKAEAYVVDVTVPFEGEDSFREARKAKEEKYTHFKQVLMSKGYRKVEVDGFVVGALGSWDPDPPNSQATEDRSPVTSTPQAPIAPGTRARPANSRGSARRTVRATVTPTPPSPSAAAPPAAQPVTITGTPPSPARVTERQYCSPEVEVNLQPPLTQASTASQEERTPSPVPVAISEEGAMRLQRLDQALMALRSHNVEIWDPEASRFSPPPMDLVTPSSTPPPATVSERQHGSPGLGVDCQPQSPPAATTLVPATTLDQSTLPLTVSSEETSMPPPSIFGSLLNVPPFIPGAHRTFSMVQQLDQVLHSLRGGEAPDTSPSLTPPYSPVHTPPPSMVPTRQHRSLEVGMVANPLPTLPAVMVSAPHTPPSSPGIPPPPARISGTPPRIAIDTENLDRTLRLPFHEELLPFVCRMLGEFEWVAFKEVLARWSSAIKTVTATRHQCQGNPTGQWARRRRQRQRAEPRADAAPPTQSPREGAPPPRHHLTTNEEPLHRPGHRASGWQRHAASSAKLQRFYRANPGACVRQILSEGPPLYCKVAEEEIVAHCSTAYAESPSLIPTREWLFPPRDTEGVEGGDILSQPFSPDEVIQQFRRMKNTAPGIDGLTYATWRWGPLYVEAFHRHPHYKGGEPSELRNWRPISLQLNIYKLYAVIIAQRVGSWATATSFFSSSQKGFLAYDGCSEHNFLLRSMLTDSRRQKRNLILVWLDIREAFPSVSHNLMLSMMERLGLSGTLLRVVQDVYSNATISVRTGKDSYTASIPQRRGVKQGCPLSPILFNIVLEGLLRHLTTSQAGYLIGTKQVNQTPHIYVDDLFTPRLGDEVIPALPWGDRYRYLGCPTGAYRTKEMDLNTIRDTLVKDTTTIFMLTFVLQVIFPGSTWCRKLDTTRRGAIKKGLKLPQRTATEYFYLPQAFGGLGVPSAFDEAHITRAVQAFKLLGDTRDPVIRSVALHQLADTVAKRARWLDPTELEDLSEFLNTSPAPGEGRAGDLQSLWSSAQDSLANGEATIKLTPDSAVLHTSNHHLS
ncbi:hypothetical protein EMCRGX_G005503 [Ephydatia muelleri]